MSDPITDVIQTIILWVINIVGWIVGLFGLGATLIWWAAGMGGIGALVYYILIKPIWLKARGPGRTEKEMKDLSQKMSEIEAEIGADDQAYRTYGTRRLTEEYRKERQKELSELRKEYWAAVEAKEKEEKKR